MGQEGNTLIPILRHVVLPLARNHESSLMSRTVTLADHADFRITYHQVGDTPTAGPLVITFGGQPSGLTDEGFGTAFCAKSGWDSIYVAQRAWSQYQGLSIKQFMDAVLPFIEGRDVVTYGASLGAYAAFYFGGAIGARIIGAAPMQSLWPEVMVKRWEGVPLIHNRLEDTPKSPTPPAVIYDPKMSRDSLVVEKILKPIYPEIRILEVPYSGHTVLVSLGEYGLLKQVIRSLVEDNVLLSPELPTETSAIWLRQRAKEIKRKNPAKAKAMLVRSLDMRPSKDTASVLLSLLIKLGDMKEAKVLIDAQSKGKKGQAGFVPSVLRLAQENNLV